MRIVLVLLAVILILTGLLVALVGVVGVFDPVGTKLADDSDPFGTPPPRWHGVVMTIAGLGLVGIGVVVVSAMIRRRRRLTP